MSQILLISGSPTASSKSSALLAYAKGRLHSHFGLDATLISVRDFPADELIQARYDSPSFDQLKAQVEQSLGIIVATPVYKAAYSGALKTLLDILPQYAFRQKTLLPIATGGSPGHLLAIDYALKPVLSTLGASDILQGVYLVDQQFRLEDGQPVIAAEVQTRLDESLDQLAANIAIRTPSSTGGQTTQITA